MRAVMSILSMTVALTLTTGCYIGSVEPEDTAIGCDSSLTAIDEQVTVSAADFAAAMGEDGALSEAECLDLCESHVTRDDVDRAVACDAPESIPDTGTAELTLECTFAPISECG